MEPCPCHPLLVPSSCLGLSRLNLPPQVLCSPLPAAEPLDASIFVLLVYYEPKGGEGPGELRTYELFVEARGEATYKVGGGTGSGASVLDWLKSSSFFIGALALDSDGLWSEEVGSSAGSSGDGAEFTKER